MIKLKELEAYMRPNFIWDRNGLKPLQVNEDFEGNKELARTVFVGIADMYGFDGGDVMNYLDCGYDSYRHKLSQFRALYKEALETTEKDAKFYAKVRLVLNAIKLATKSNPYFKLEEYL